MKILRAAEYFNRSLIAHIKRLSYVIYRTNRMTACIPPPASWTFVSHGPASESKSQSQSQSRKGTQKQTSDGKTLSASYLTSSNVPAPSLPRLTHSLSEPPNPFKPPASLSGMKHMSLWRKKSQRKCRTCAGPSTCVQAPTTRAKTRSESGRLDEDRVAFVDAV